MVWALQYGICCLALLLFYIFIASIHCCKRQICFNLLPLWRPSDIPVMISSDLSLTLKKLEPELEMFRSISIVKTIVCSRFTVYHI